MARRFGFLSRYLNSIASAVVGGGFVVNLGTTLTVNDAHGQLREQLKKQFTKGDNEGQWDNGGQVFELGQPNQPTETCLQLYRSNISGVAGPSAQKKTVFAQKWPKIANFLPKILFF